MSGHQENEIFQTLAVDDIVYKTKLTRKFMMRKFYEPLDPKKILSFIPGTIQEIKALGVKAGVSINPATSLSTLDYILEDVDLVLIMSVNPGFGGQKFIPSALEKVRALKEIREYNNLKFEIEIDGGVTLQNLEEVVSAGVDIVVAGSAVFGAENVEERTKEFVNI